MTFRVSEKDISIGPDGNSLGAGQRRQFRRTAVSRETFLASTGEVVQCLILKINPVDGVSFTQRQIQAVLSVEVECSRPVQRRSFQ